MWGILVIDYLELARLPIWQFERPMNEKRIALKVITGYEFDNENLKVQSVAGNLYSLMIKRETCQWGSIRHKELQEMFGEQVEINKTYTLHLWNGWGGISLYGTTFEIKDYNDTLPKEVMSAIDLAMSEYEEGRVVCSDCRGITDANSGRRYFAGIYCKPCWEGTTGKYIGKGGWREVEAKETYN